MCGTTNFNFLVTLSQPTVNTVTVNYATANGTATSPSDYAATSGTLTFNPGQTSKTITVGVVGDTVMEMNENFFVNLSNATNAMIMDGSGMGTIINDDTGHLVAAGGPGEGGEDVVLTQEQVDTFLREAGVRWEAAGVDVSALYDVQLVIADLADGIIGQVEGNTITIDINAAGFGWFVDETPADNVEFATATAAGEYQAAADSPASHGMDLLTVLLHEDGHVLGLGHSSDPHDVMAATLAMGIRRVPTSTTVGNAVINDGPGPDGLHAAPAGGLPLVPPGDLLSEFRFDFDPIAHPATRFDVPEWPLPADG